MLRLKVGWVSFVWALSTLIAIMIAVIASVKICGAGPPDRASKHSDSDDDLYHDFPLARMASAITSWS